MSSSSGPGMDKPVLMVGLACYDVVNVVASYPAEDTDQKSLDQYWLRCAAPPESAF